MVNNMFIRFVSGESNTVMLASYTVALWIVYSLFLTLYSRDAVPGIVSTSCFAHKAFKIKDQKQKPHIELPSTDHFQSFTLVNVQQHVYKIISEWRE